MNKLLKEDFSLDPFASFNLVLEGNTDVRYLECAVRMVRSESGEDVLAVPSHLNAVSPSIRLLAPGTKGDATRGGVPQMVRLARAIQPFVFTLQMVQGVVFVFDHDEAGLTAQKEIVQYGFKPGQHSLTLDPAIHRGACANKQVVVEDLLSLEIQKTYFDSHNPTCSVDYVNGEPRRYHWAHESKGNLCEYACQNGTSSDFTEVIRLFQRVRETFGFTEG